MKKQIIMLISSVVLMAQSCYYDNREELYQYIQQQECNLTEATYTANIAPILTSNCIRCHNAQRQDGNVNLEGFNQVKPYADSGKLYGTINHDPGYLLMPTDGVKIPFCDIEQVRLWVEGGAQNN